MLMRPFRQGVSLLREDVSVMDDAPQPPSPAAAEPPHHATSAGWSSRPPLVAEGGWTKDPQGTQPTGDPVPPPRAAFLAQDVHKPAPAVLSPGRPSCLEGWGALNAAPTLVWCLRRPSRTHLWCCEIVSNDLHRWSPLGYSRHCVSHWVVTHPRCVRHCDSQLWGQMSSNHGLILVRKVL